MNPALALLSIGLVLEVAPASGREDAGATAPHPTAAVCTDEYADDMTIISPRVRELERQPKTEYSYCVANTATYECLSYGADGNIRRSRKKAILHGTAFGYRQQGGETLLLTNQHVADWPAVTDEDHAVEGVPAGCKKISDALRIVDGEADAYERDDIALARVVSDRQLDVAILKAHASLNVMPWRIGRSAALKERNVVQVRGFPLGAFQATNMGKVVSAYDHDDDKDWDHDDFVVDALLSPGSSGSPVLAVSCKTGEFELVGIYHARYTEGSALNVVVGIDQLRDLMTTLKRSPRSHPDTAGVLDEEGRKVVVQVARRGAEPFFPFGALTASVHARSDGALVFLVYARDFPTKTYPAIAFEDLPAAPPSFGQLGRTWFGGPQGLKVYPRSEVEAELSAQLARTLDALRTAALATLTLRSAERDTTTRERFEQVARLERSLARTVASQRELAQGAAEMAERLGPHGAEVALAATDPLATPPQLPSASRPSAPTAQQPAAGAGKRAAERGQPRPTAQ